MFRSRPHLLCLALMVALLATTGCVRRRLTVLSNPSGALCYVDNQAIGYTPCSVDFVYYGTREIRLVKPGFETLTVNQPIPTPWYQYPPLDFFSDNLALRKIRDDRTVSFNLEPQRMMSTDEIIARGEQLRQGSRQQLLELQGAVPANPTAPKVRPMPPVLVNGAPAPPPVSTAPNFAPQGVPFAAPVLPAVPAGPPATSTPLPAGAYPLQPVLPNNPASPSANPAAPYGF